MLLNNFYKGKVIWITGASGGLGRELAIALSKYDVKLILSARQDLKLRETKRLCGLPDHKCLIIPLDLTQFHKDHIEMIKDRILLKFGALDMIVHNASLSQRSFAHETAEPVERKIMETNFFGPIRLTKCVLPTLMKSECPHIVVISSLCGKFGVPLRSMYSAAKHALHGFFESMTLELNQKVNISMFVLGGVKTESAKHALNADGSVNDRLDLWHERNMPADKCANEIIKKIPSKQTEFVIGKMEKLGLYLRKHWPTLHKKVLLKFFSKEKEALFK